MIQERDTPRIAVEARARVVEHCMSAATNGGRPLEQVLNETLFHEKRRLRRHGGTDGERAFYDDVAHALPRASEGELRRMLGSVVGRYLREIEGHFDPRIYKVTTSVLPLGIGALLNAMSAKRLLQDGAIPSFDKRILIEGEVEPLHRLAERGTVIYVPTHSSNLDSIILGSGLSQLGLPPATYGAGLNLFDNKMIGFFMRNLGAYTVDRTKTDPLYRETLKAYSTVILEYGRHQLFFPGGTRGRSGAVETHLKKGLLGTALEAYGQQLRRGKDRRLYFVPVTVNYPLVLEASTLIDDYLQDAGRARYIIADDEFSQLERWAAYGKGLFRLDMYIHLRFGAALDPFGNPVSVTGDSLDPSGRVIEPSGYLKLHDEVVADAARDEEYTRMLSRSIVASYKSNNVACATHAVCFALFHSFWQSLQPKDVYRFLRLISEHLSVHWDDLLATLDSLLKELRGLNEAGEIQLEPILRTGSADEVLRHALAPLASYHARPVVERRGDRLAIGDANLLFYYRNRLEGYGLLGERPVVQQRHEA